MVQTRRPRGLAAPWGAGSGDFEVRAIFVEVKGLEPSTYGLQSRRSSS